MDFHNRAGQKIGILKEGIFRKKVSKKRHLMKRNNSWGFDSEVIWGLQKEGCHTIKVLDEDTNIVYETTMEKFLKESIGDNWGHSEQFFMSLDKWDKYNKL